MKKLFQKILLVLLWLPLIAGAATNKEQRTAVIALLNAYDRGATPAQWARVGNEGGPLLLQLYHEPSANTARRARILGALRYFPSPEANQLLESTADSTSALPVLRRQAVSSLVALQGSAALPRLARLLKEDDWRLRRRILEELAPLPDPAAQQLLTEHLKQEKSPLVRRALQRRLKKSK